MSYFISISGHVTAPGPDEALKIEEEIADKAAEFVAALEGVTAAKAGFQYFGSVDFLAVAPADEQPVPEAAATPAEPVAPATPAEPVAPATPAEAPVEPIATVVAPPDFEDEVAEEQAEQEPDIGDLTPGREQPAEVPQDDTAVFEGQE